MRRARRAHDLVAEACTEGRVCALEFERFSSTSTRPTRAKRAQLAWTCAWPDDASARSQSLEAEGKPVVTCGDFNVAHQEIDSRTLAPTAATPVLLTRSGKFTELLDAWFTDTGACSTPRSQAYSRWSYRLTRARTTPAGASILLGERRNCQNGAARASEADITGSTTAQSHSSPRAQRFPVAPASLQLKRAGYGQHHRARGMRNRD